MSLGPKRIVLWLIEWVDSVGPRGWARASEIDHAVGRMQSVGRIVQETDEMIAIAGHWQLEEYSQFNGIILIPKQAIVRKRRLATLVRQ